MLKDISLGAMSIFSSILAIIATARLLPREIEDRTVYTILAKPVHRFEYLCAKLAGVILLLALSIAMMSALFFAVLYVREHAVLTETARHLRGLSDSEIAAAIRDVHRAGFKLNLFPGIAIIFLKASLLASLTLFVSTIATTNIFTIVVVTFTYFAGHLQAIAREYWLQHNGGGWFTQLFLALVTLLFPDLQTFNLVDNIVAGTAIPLALFLKTALLGTFYTTIYLLLAVMVFYGKEL